MPTRNPATLVVDMAWLIRLPNCLAAAAATALGAYLVGGTGSFESRTVIFASGAAALIHAAGNVFNDLRDRAIDLVNKPQRPLPSGRVSVPVAAILAATTAAAGLGLAFGVGLAFAGLAAVLGGLGFAYSYRLKNSILVGNATVALLAGSAIAYGALAAGGLNAAVGVACGLTFLYMLAFEVLKTIQDWAGDSAAGLRTVAGLDGRQPTRLFQCLAVIFAGAAVWPWLIGFAPRSYLLVILLGTVVPVLGVAVVLALRPTDESMNASWAAMKLAWPFGMLAMVLLR